MGQTIPGIILWDELPLGPYCGFPVRDLTTEQMRHVRADYVMLCNKYAYSNRALSDDLRNAIQRIDAEGTSRSKPQPAPRRP